MVDGPTPDPIRKIEGSDDIERKGGYTGDLPAKEVGSPPKKQSGAAATESGSATATQSSENP